MSNTNSYVYIKKLPMLYRTIEIEPHVLNNECLLGKNLNIYSYVFLRSVEETLRLVQAFQYTDKHGEVCPANWQPGSKTIKPDTKAAQEYFIDAN